MRILPPILLFVVLCAGCTQSSAQDGYTLSFSPSLQECEQLYTRLSAETEHMNHCSTNADCVKMNVDKCGRLINASEEPTSSLRSGWDQYANFCEQPGAYTCPHGALVCNEGTCVQELK